MISGVQALLACHWSARRMQRYLDADPSAPLRPAEVRRLEAHLARCERCAQLAREHRLLRQSLLRWSDRHWPDDGSLTRMHGVLDQLVRDGLA